MPLPACIEGKVFFKSKRQLIENASYTCYELARQIAKYIDTQGIDGVELIELFDERAVIDVRIRKDRGLTISVFNLEPINQGDYPKILNIGVVCDFEYPDSLLQIGYPEYGEKNIMIKNGPEGPDFTALADEVALINSVIDAGMS